MTDDEKTRRYLAELAGMAAVAGDNASRATCLAGDFFGDGDDDAGEALQKLAAGWRSIAAVCRTTAAAVATRAGIDPATVEDIAVAVLHGRDVR